MRPYYAVFVDKTLLEQYIFLFQAEDMAMARRAIEPFRILGLPGFELYTVQALNVAEFDSCAEDVKVAVYGINHFLRIHEALRT